MTSHINIPNHGKIFCYAKKSIVKLDEIIATCNNCKYYGGTGQGQGIECVWNDGKKTCVTVYFPSAEQARVNN